MEYRETNVLCLAKRQNNKKRAYLLVNPLQAKHIPTRPREALQMMNTLGTKLAEKYPEAKLLIAFAETATAIGAAAASCMPENCFFLTTTRETIKGHQWAEFQEEHSHATEQKLCVDSMKDCLRHTETIILLDDEISTGRTIRNMISQLKKIFPEIIRKKVVAASILNRLSQESEKEFLREGIAIEYLLKLPLHNYTEQVALWVTQEALSPLPYKICDQLFIMKEYFTPIGDQRIGVYGKEYQRACRHHASIVLEDMIPHLKDTRQILVLGTEEFMYPALVFGRLLEDRFPYASVFCHATTRSPIGISMQEGYPIRSGTRLRSLYQTDRETFLYNLKSYDAAIILTDAPAYNPDSVMDLRNALIQNGTKKLFFLKLQTIGEIKGCSEPIMQKM